jgi:hypothetical protein
MRTYTVECPVTGRCICNYNALSDYVPPGCVKRCIGSVRQIECNGSWGIRAAVTVIIVIFLGTTAEYRRKNEKSGPSDKDFLYKISSGHWNVRIKLFHNKQTVGTIVQQKLRDMTVNQSIKRKRSMQITE